MTPAIAKAIAQALHKTPYENRRSDHTCDAQENLEGRSHYAEPNTLKFHKSRIVGSGVHLCGAAYRLVESTAIDYENTRRGYRVVLFDLLGQTIYCPDLEEMHRTKDQALRAFWAWFETFDPVQHYRNEISRKTSELARQIIELNDAARILAELEQTEATAA